MSRKRCHLRLCWIVVLSLTGCGGADPFERYEVAGTVTYQGSPVQHGTLRFEPHATVGAEAPTAYGKIEEGAFLIPREEGPIEGKYKVYVSGFDHSKMDPNPAPHEPVETPELFPTFQLDVDVPLADGKLEIQVPDAPPRS
jgi:hypothetical protein